MEIPLVARAEAHRERTAILTVDAHFSYRQLLDASARVAGKLLDSSDERTADDLAEERVALLVPPGFRHVAIQWGIWRAGGVAVPLCPSHPPPELDYAIGDAGARTVVSDPDFEALLRPIVEARGLRWVPTDPLFGGPSPESLPAIEPRRRAMILYTSGTTSRPKGVVSTHRNIQAQIETLVAAWEWRADDRILHVLPLHHVHGIVNALCCALWSGAACEMMDGFRADEVWQRFAEGETTLFMAVPTIYARLVDAWEKAPAERRRILSAACSAMRLQVSGSAALPVDLFERWREICGRTLLERYGLTETGMVLSNPLRGPRRPGSVGTPLPGVEVRLVGEDGNPVEPGSPGEILVRGPGVFAEYWNRPGETREAFSEGWFRTGDLAVVEDGAYRILGRQSVDIIKTGGYKVSALEIEEVLRTHPGIEDCAVVGVPQREWGEQVAVAVVPATDEELQLDDLRDWAKKRLAPYKVPARLVQVESLPRNTLGKVLKKKVAALF